MGRGGGERGRGEKRVRGAERMGEGLFVHATNSLGVISIGRSIIAAFEEEEKNRERMRAFFFLLFFSLIRTYY